MDEVIDAAKNANIHNFITSQPLVGKDRRSLHCFSIVLGVRHDARSSDGRLRICTRVGCQTKYVSDTFETLR